MWDPLTSCSLAGNIVQLIGFSCNLLNESFEIYRTGSVSANAAELQGIASDLRALSAGIDSSLDVTTAAEKKGKLKTDEIALKVLAEKTKAVANELVTALGKLQLRGSQSHKRTHSLFQALRNAIGRTKVDKIRKRLIELRSELQLSVLVELRQNARARDVCTGATFETLDAKLQTVIRTIFDESNRSAIELGAQTRTLLQRLDTSDNPNRQYQPKIPEVISDISASAGESQLERSTATPSATITPDIANEAQNGVLERLAFRQISVREESLDLAHEHTFDWILRKDSYQDRHWHNLVQWLRDGTGIYWICGKAGSGKSTLLKFLTSQGETLKALQHWSEGNELHVASHFFWHLGTTLQKSLDGLLRTLLHSILEKKPSLVALVIPGFYNELAEQVLVRNQEQRCEVSRVQDLSSHEIKIAFLKLMQVLPENARVCLFIDGIDEHEGDYNDLIRLLKVVASEKVKMVVSSRPIPACRSAFQQVPSLNLQELTYSDILKYVEAHILRHPNTEFLPTDPEHGVQVLINGIANRSSGVFLWVTLVVKLILKALDAGDGLDELMKKLNEYPPELEDFYKHMMDSMEEFHRIQASQYLQITLRTIEVQANHPLTLLQMFFADDPHQFGGDASVQSDTSTPSDLTRACKNMEARLISRCCGLIEASDSSPKSPVKFLHKTVVDFLRQPGIWKYIISLTAPDSTYDTNYALSHSCLALLKMGDRMAIMVDYFLRYSRDGEKSSHRTQLEPFNEFVELVMASPWLSESLSIPVLGTLDIEDELAVASNTAVGNGRSLHWLDPLSMALQNGLYLLWSELWASCDSTEAAEKGPVMLRIALFPHTVKRAQRGFIETRSVHADFTQALKLSLVTLFKSGADPNAVRRKELSAWCDALIWARLHYGEPCLLLYLQMLSIFLEYGADPRAELTTISNQGTGHKSVLAVMETLAEDIRSSANYYGDRDEAADGAVARSEIWEAAQEVINQIVERGGGESSLGMAGPLE